MESQEGSVKETGMIDILAAVTGEATGHWVEIGLVLGGILAAFGAGGGAGAVVQKRRSNGNGEAKPQSVCLLHAEMVKLLDERKETADNEMAGIKEDVKDFRRETNDNFKQVFDRIDRAMLRDP